jgi:CHAT domain
MTNPNMAHYDNCLNKIKTLILFLRIETQEDMYYDLTLSTKTEIASEMLHTMKVPLSPQLLDDLEVFQNNYRSRGSLENRAIQEQALACQIYQNFFPSVIGQICKESVSLLDKQQIETVLLVISSDDKCIINLPFELTLPYFCPSELRHNSFLINRSFGLIRTTCVSVEEFKGESATPKVAPLKMLFIAALPENLEERHKMLQLEAEQEQLIHSIGSLAEHQKPKIVIEFLENASLEELDKALRERQHDIVHISGHGAYESKQNNSILYFEDAFGNVAPVTGKQLGEILQKHLSIKLLMLSACETALAGEAGSIAQQTALSGALTVIGMRFQISDAAAQLFTTCFYTQLANQASVTRA